MKSMSICLLLGLSAAVVAGEPIAFVTQPSVRRDGRNVEIQFEVSHPTDVEVAILDKKRTVVRHLAAGSLGARKPPPSPLNSGLSQSIRWDGLDDYGEAVESLPDCSVRVRAGMHVQLDRVVGGDPYAFYSKEMGQGDHAAWRITGLEAKSDGKVYVLGNANNYGPPALRQYDAAGNYLSTVYPPPAGKRFEQIKGWGARVREDGTYSFCFNDLSSPALSTTFIAGTRGRVATLIPSPHADQLLLTYDSQLMRVNVDGTIPENPLLEGLLVNEPALTPSFQKPAKEPWKLTGPMQTSLSPEGKFLFLGGLFAGTLDDRGRRIGAQNKGFWRDGQVFRVDLATRKASSFFALDQDTIITDADARRESPIADARYGTYAALQGVAAAAEGRVFVCDRQNERILILDGEGKVIREIAVAHPDAIAVSPASKALYVTTRTGHYHGKGELKLLRFNDWSVDKTPSVVLPLCEVRAYSQATCLTVAEAEGEVYVWVAYTALPVRVYRETGAGIELVKDFYEVGQQRALDLQHIAADPKTEDVYVADGFNRCFRITDWNDPQFELCMRDAQTPLKALSIAIDSRNRWLYAHADRKPVLRFRLDGEYFADAPADDSSQDNVFTPNMSNDWRIGLGFGDRGIAAAPDGGLATLGALGTKADYSGYLRFFKANQAKFPPEGLLINAFGTNVRAAGVRFDPAGNLYVGKFEKSPEAPPAEFKNDSNFLRSMGRIYKFAPTGSLKSGNLYPTAPDRAAKVYDIHYGAIGPQFSRTPRFGVDGFGRIYYPTSLLPRVTIIDNEGNEILAFGTYGNRDSLGGLKGDLVPTKGIPMAWPNSVDATDNYIYVADIVNIRLLRLAKTFAASETVHIK